MADLTAPVPLEPQKATYLHDRSNRPDAPSTKLAGSRELRAFVLGFLCAMGFVALAFQTRATWDGQRDWVVPTTTPFFVMGGVALAAVIARREVKLAAPALGLLAVAVVLTALNIWRGAVVDGEDGLRDAMSIITGVLMGATIVAAAGALVVMEWKRPIQAPAAEV